MCVCSLTACISSSSLWYLMMVLLSFSFSALSSSCSLRFSFSFLCTSVSGPRWPTRTVSLLFITSASLLTACEQKQHHTKIDLFMTNTAGTRGKPGRTEISLLIFVKLLRVQRVNKTANFCHYGCLSKQKNRIHSRLLSGA